MEASETLLLGGTAVVVPGQAAYLEFPGKVIRDYVDGKFPMFKSCAEADYIKGAGHRWEGGHDLLISPTKTLFENGPASAYKHAAHILTTDFPTKAGMPIPGLSGEGLGRWLVDAGIPKGYLSIHWADGCLGFLAISEGHSDLVQAIHGSLPMDVGTFFDTFVNGSVELALAEVAKNAWTLARFNPTLIFIGGVENILAGLVSVYQTFSVYVNPLDFFGSAGTSALIGFGLAYGVANETLSDASIDGIRAGVVGAFFSLSSAFGYGALAGFVSFKLGRKLANVHNSSSRALLKIDESSYRQLLDEMCSGNIHLSSFIERAETFVNYDVNVDTFADSAEMLGDNVGTLPEELLLLDSEIDELPELNERLNARQIVLPDDSPVLSNWYRAVFGSRGTII